MTSRLRLAYAAIVVQPSVFSDSYASRALQFSDHEMVRRAATEAMCNLLPHPKMMEHMRSSETLKLWAAFAKLGLEDPPTAAAAIGGLAMAVMDPEVKDFFLVSYLYFFHGIFL